MLLSISNIESLNNIEMILSSLSSDTCKALPKQISEFHNQSCPAWSCFTKNQDINDEQTFQGITVDVLNSHDFCLKLSIFDPLDRWSYPTASQVLGLLFRVTLFEFLPKSGDNFEATFTDSRVKVNFSQWCSAPKKCTINHQCRFSMKKKQQKNINAHRVHGPNLAKHFGKIKEYCHELDHF